ncbi:MdtA/MuxA family multidrug efflux RND transporter periplasmic adaptor subunit [Janthinobacterium sp. 17J80-10]|uniref:MdtA/MuxA family multidrug efflux RND transporter periplasmic adaptor subunit n=1 Tax=Janthinobacterium sp. 17J80-10 TaxID=2497863 RepID=UPI0010055FAF|nr:MdtA/MuxA family multidrug efflux RND transporter periplasmic adaptor subunit [Janthinobacterium sp. 17J80-10]QAU33945.1 MdtA/MuxA family multidrug efflux RND transporter periplasmic adaptor subunit [Janthinobacterium sp. 17J80-10]
MLIKNSKPVRMAAGGLFVLALGLGAGSYWKIKDTQAASAPAARNAGNARPIPVIAQPVKTQDVRIVQNGLGTVVSQASVTVRARVNGQLQRVLFKEGQAVKAGEVLAEIDPRPFAAQLAQVQGQATRNLALLKNAQIDLERYRQLREQNSISTQQVDTQESLVQQYKGTVQADQGLLDNARLQLEFTRIAAPISGKIGLRQIDSGNNISTTDSTGLAVITALQPIGVVFALPEDVLPNIAARLAASQKSGKPLEVEAWDRGSKKLLAKGELLTIDNQIDPASGTVKFKALFPNTDNTLFPNQFVNIRLLTETRANATVAPNAAIQRGSQGPFVYVVGADNTVTVKPVKPGPVEAGVTLISEGLNAGEIVVVNGVDKLREGAKVAVSSGREGATRNAKGQGKPRQDGATADTVRGEAGSRQEKKPQPERS